MDHRSGLLDACHLINVSQYDRKEETVEESYSLSALDEIQRTTLHSNAIYFNARNTEDSLGHKQPTV